MFTKLKVFPPEVITRIEGLLGINIRPQLKIHFELLHNLDSVGFYGIWAKRNAADLAWAFAADPGICD